MAVPSTMVSVRKGVGRDGVVQQSIVPSESDLSWPGAGVGRSSGRSVSLPRGVCSSSGHLFPGQAGPALGWEVVHKAVQTGFGVGPSSPSPEACWRGQWALYLDLGGGPYKSEFLMENLKYVTAVFIFFS